ncbi:hypothetical protein [Cutibacterium namnetense]|nr:hypothetical protein [Cutibacterium namnetense]
MFFEILSCPAILSPTAGHQTVMHVHAEIFIVEAYNPGFTV